MSSSSSSSSKKRILHGNSIESTVTDDIEANSSSSSKLLLAEREEMVKLTKLAKSWDFTCSFCFKKFPSAQAMGGHQNAHKNERLEEKRLFVKDPIGYRKRAYLRTLKKARSSSPSSAKDNTDACLVIADQQLVDVRRNYEYLPFERSSKDATTINGEELNLVEKIGDGEDHAIELKESCLDKFNGGVVDLTLRL